MSIFSGPPSPSSNSLPFFQKLRMSKFILNLESIISCLIILKSPLDSFNGRWFPGSNLCSLHSVRQRRSCHNIRGDFFFAVDTILAPQHKLQFSSGKSGVQATEDSQALGVTWNLTKIACQPTGHYLMAIPLLCEAWMHTGR